MADIRIARNEVEDPVLARQYEREVEEAAAPAASPGDSPLGCSILDEGLYLEIEVEVPGWIERVTVARPAERGAVRRAVQRVLSQAGLELS